jgi:hypothetical protein
MEIMGHDQARPNCYIMVPSPLFLIRVDNFLVIQEAIQAWILVLIFSDKNLEKTEST